MSVHRVKRIVVFSCDGCPDTIDTETTDFNEAFKLMKIEGWTFEKNKHGFEHFCPDCSTIEVNTGKGKR